jgi:adenylate cyclase
VLTLGIAGRVYNVPWVEWVRVKTFDIYQRIEPRKIQNLPVGIIDIDEKSLFEIGQWPWPRTVLADLLDRLSAAGAGGIAFDMVFPEYDRTSPDRIADVLRGADDELLAKLRALPRSESVLANAMKKIPTVVGQVGLSTPLPEGKAPPSNRSAVKGVLGAGGYPYNFITAYTAFMGNVPEIEKAAAGHGIFSVAYEYDGLIRRVPLISRVGKNVRPALVLELLRVAFGSKSIFVKRDAAGISHILLQTRQGNFSIPTDSRGRIWVHFSKPDAFNTPDNSGRLYISAADIIKGRVPKERLAGKLFLLGTSAVGLVDIRATPISERLPGVEVHANILESIFSAYYAKQAQIQIIAKRVGDEAKAKGLKPKSPELIALSKAANTEILLLKDEDFYLKYPPIAVAIEVAMILFAGLFMTVLIPRLGPMWTLGGIVTTGAVLIGGSWYLYTEYLTLIDVTYPAIVTMSLYSVLTFGNYMREAAEKKQVRGAFAQYLSPALVEQLAENPESLALGGETKEMTFLFCDVRGFTAISETFKTNPHGLTNLINRLLTPLTNVILSNSGTIDKYMGDCIMAFWNAPLNVEDHPIHACTSALLMFDELDILNEERRLEDEEAGIPHLPLKVGTGINTGICVVGNMGSDQRFDYSVLGDPVNLAARLESQSKNYGVRIVLGPQTAAEAADEFAILEMDLIQVKGQSVGVDIYCLLGDATFAANPDYIALKTEHDEFIVQYRSQQWDQAESLMDSCRAMAQAQKLDLDVLYDLYVERIEHNREVPPPVDWDGVFVATSK